MKAYLVRTDNTAGYTAGYLIVNGKWFVTLERPWSDNERNKSCIPAGTYNAVFLPRSSSGKYRNVYHVQQVPGRSGILIHNGNLVSHTRGCILLGTRTGNINGNKAVLNSRTAMRKFNEATAGQNIELEIS